MPHRSPHIFRRVITSTNACGAPHAARRIYDPTTTTLRHMLWDADGNLAQTAQYLYDANNQQVFLQDFRNHYWDEEDRLNIVLDNSHFSYYLYGHDGQRVAKLTGSAFTLGQGFATNALLDNYTLYPSEYLVITQQGYTKYYYAGGTRIASRLGSGGFEKMTRLCSLDQNMTYNANSLFYGVVARIGEDMPQESVSYPCPTYYNDMAFEVSLPDLNFGPNFGITAQQNVLQAFRQNYANEETYYFHGNHLGSANVITTPTAAPTQFLLHLPYGEEFVKQLNSTYDERFTFTGKEKDIETGYYYFGARFNSSDIGWLSVDPMADKYPNVSPYAYCAWNPIKLVDPEGKKVIVTGSQADDVVTHLQSDKMVINRDEKTGELSVSLGKYKERNLSPDEKLIYDAITCSDVTINVSAINTGGFVYINNKKAITNGGSFMSSHYNENGTANTECTIDVSLLNKNGINQGVPHEISEQLLAGRWSIKNKEDILPPILLDMAFYSGTKLYPIHLQAIPERVDNEDKEFLGRIRKKLGKTSFLKTREYLKNQLNKQ